MLKIALAIIGMALAGPAYAQSCPGGLPAGSCETFSSFVNSASAAGTLSPTDRSPYVQGSATKYLPGASIVTAPTSPYPTQYDLPYFNGGPALADAIGVVYSPTNTAGGHQVLSVGSNNSWVSTQWPNTWGGGQINTASQVGEFGVIAASRASDNTNLDSIGADILSFNNNTTNTLPAGTWGIYVEADSASGLHSPTQVIEADMGNNDTPNIVSPFALHPNNVHADLWVACGGGGFGGSGGSQPCDLAMAVLPNVQPFEVGIIFQSTALVTSNGAGGSGVAMEMAAGQDVVWKPSSGTVTPDLFGSNAGLTLQCNAQGVLPATSADEVTMCANRSSGGGEINIYNDTVGGGGFEFDQMTGTGTFASLASLTTAGFTTGAVKANVYNSGASSGVTCSGSPTSSFATVGGIVVHC